MVIKGDSSDYDYLAKWTKELKPQDFCLTVEIGVREGYSSDIIMKMLKDRNHFQPNVKGLEDKIVKVGLNAGDLLIFNSSEPHGIRPNYSKDKVRIAQYISMMPAQEDNIELKNWRIKSWKDRIAPEGYAFPGDPRNWEQQKYKTAILSELGKKLLGLNKW